MFIHQTPYISAVFDVINKYNINYRVISDLHINRWQNISTTDILKARILKYMRKWMRDIEIRASVPNPVMIQKPNIYMVQTGPIHKVLGVKSTSTMSLLDYFRSFK